MKHTLTLLTALLLAPLATLQAAEPPKGEPTNAAEAAAQEAAAKKAKADAATDAKYQAIVATLPAEQQAWERTLQENLGGFYLPPYKRLRVEGRSSCWDYVQDDPKLPRVLLIGDSVSGGYTLSARKALAGKANVHKAPENCGPTANGLKKLDIWLGGEKWDVIHFNFGLHDSRTPVADYEGRLREIVARLKKTGAKLIWASTTPRPADGKEGPGIVAAVVERNEIAARVMKENGIVIDDLYTAVVPHQAEMQNPKDVHFNAKGYEFLGATVAKAIEAALK
jgi:lysophospholipase L1-like esterase